MCEEPWSCLQVWELWGSRLFLFPMGFQWNCIWFSLLAQRLDVALLLGKIQGSDILKLSVDLVTAEGPTSLSFLSLL